MSKITVKPFKKRAYKKSQPTKRKYVKRTKKDDINVTGNNKVEVVWVPQQDELDLLRDMLANFESMAEDARYRAYNYFTSKYSKYGTTF